MHCNAGMPDTPSFSTFEKLLASTSNEGNGDDGDRRSLRITNRVVAATAVGEISKELVCSHNKQADEMQTVPIGFRPVRLVVQGCPDS